MINPTDLVRGPKNRKEVERGERKAELGVCRIRKLPKDGKGYRTVGSGSVIRNVLIDWPGYKDKCCLVTTDKVLPDEDFDVKDFVLDFRKLNSTYIREFKLANYANQNAVFRFTSGLVVIPLDPKGFETVKKPSIFTFRPFTIESGSLGKLFCPTLEDLDGKHFTVRKDFALKHLEDQLESNKYVLCDEHSSVSFNTLGGFIGTSNRKPHGAVILSDKECKAVGVLYCPRDQPSRISPIWLSQGNLKPSSVGSPEVRVVAEQPEAVEPYLNDQPLHNKEVDVSGMIKEDATTLSKKCPKKSRGISESTPDPEASSENDNVPKVDSLAEQQLVAEACDTDCRTSEQQPVGLDEEKNASGTNNPVTVIKNSFQELSDEQQEEVHTTLTRQINVYMKHHKVTTHDGVGALIEYIKETHNLALKSVGVSSLVIKVQCPTLKSLESLWKDYCSGHLNEVAGRYLVTDEIKRKLNLETLRLKTTIEEENYLICKKALMEKSREAGTTDFSNEEIEPDQGGDRRWIDTSSHFQKNQTQDQSWMVRAEKAKASRRALHKASITGQYETVKMLLDSGEDVDQRDKFSLTPLHLACWYGQESVVKLLLEHGANVNAVDKFRRTPLQKADRQNHQSIVQLLLKKNAVPSYQQPLSLKALSRKAFLDVDRRSGFNVLQAAVFEGEYSIVWKAHALLDDFVKAVKLKITGNEAKLFPGKTAVDILSNIKEKRPGHAEIEKLYQENVEIDSTLTELHRCRSGNDAEQAVELSLNDGVDINIPALCNRTPLLWASASSSSTFIKTLVDLGADVNVQRTNDKVAPLYLAAYCGNYMATRLFVDHGADVNIQDVSGEAALHTSVGNGFYEVSQLLIEARSNINLRNKKGRTPLYLAVQNKYEELVKLLLESNADVSMVYKEDPEERAVYLVRGKFNGKPAWHYVLVNKNLLYLFLKGTNVGSIDVADFGKILRSGWGKDSPANTFDEIRKEYDEVFKDTPGETLLHVASRSNNTEIIDLLVTYGADVNAQGVEGFTPLHMAAIYGNVHVVKKLVDIGADVNLSTANGKDAVDLAYLTEDAEIEEYLKSKMAASQRTKEKEMDPGSKLGIILTEAYSFGSLQYIYSVRKNLETLNL